jgi:hypothetical protein
VCGAIKLNRAHPLYASEPGSALPHLHRDSHPLRTTSRPCCSDPVDEYGRQVSLRVLLSPFDCEHMTSGAFVRDPTASDSVSGNE